MILIDAEHLILVRIEKLVGSKPLLFHVPPLRVCGVVGYLGSKLHRDGFHLISAKEILLHHLAHPRLLIELDLLSSLIAR